MHRGRRMLVITRACLVAVLTLPPLFSVAAHAGASTELVPRHLRAKPAHTQLWPGLRDDRVIVKFVEDSRVRLRQARLESRTGRNVAAANSLLATRADLTLARLFTRPETVLEDERLRAQNLSGRQMADLNNYYTATLAAGDVAAVEALLDALNALDIVEIAYAEPIPRTADMSQAEIEAGRRARGQASPLPTPDFVSMQDYLEAAPLGVDAFAAWTYAGGRGQGVKVIDIELGWNWSHEDHKTPFYERGVSAYSDHGIAVVGEIMGQDNGYGITGISNAVEIGSHSVWSVPTADVFNQVVAALDPGDIYLIELHCPGPQATGGGQDGYIALEWWQANFDAIAIGSALGVICCEAAGNGAVDFDHAAYEGLFDRNVRDSGAIIVGAAVGTTRAPEWFTNHGARVDLHGWGSNVVTTGYGDLHGGSADDLYTAFFGGTSGATPIVVGAVACLQGAYKALSGGVPLPPGTIAQVLKETGTPQIGSQHIGPRPDLAAAIPALTTSLATLEGTVTDIGSGAALADVELRLLETGAQAITGADGSYTLLVTGGSWNLQASRFGYNTEVVVVNPIGGGTAVTDFDLQTTTTRNLRGIVRAESGLPLAGITVEALATPLAPTTTGADGRYTLSDLPVGLGGIVQAHSSGYAPDAAAFAITFTGDVVNLRLAAPDDFETGGGGFAVDDGQWAVGTPVYAGGPSAHSGSRCWGINLTGPYSTFTSHELHSASYDLTELDEPRLGFWQWYAIWGPYDGANVAISTNGGSIWSVIEPVGEYDDSCIYALTGPGCQPGYTATSGTWVPAVFDLSAYADETVMFRLRLDSYDYTDAAGWYIDDFKVHGGTTTSAVLPVEAARFLLQQPAPNPMTAGTTLRFGLAQSAHVDLRVFDTAGRLVRVLEDRVLPAGTHQNHWTGRNQVGHDVAPGVYFVRLRSQAPGGQEAEIAEQRVLVVR